MMAQYDRSIRERIIAFAEEVGLRDRQVGRRRGTELWCISSPAQNAVLVAEAQKNPFTVKGILKLLLAFLGKKTKLISRLKEAGRRA
jgi:hypothetical protein